MKRFFVACMFVGVFFLGATYGLNKAMTIVEQTLAQETAPVTPPSQPLKFGGTTGAFPSVYLPECEVGDGKKFHIDSSGSVVPVCSACEFKWQARTKPLGHDTPDGKLTLDRSESVAALSTATTHDAIRITISAPMVSLSMTHARQEDHSECKRCGHALNVLPKDDPRFRRHQYEGLMSMEIRVTNEEGKTVFDGCLWCLAKILDKETKK